MAQLALLTKASQTIPFLHRRSLMPKVNLSGMKIEELMDLQKRIEEMLGKQRWEIEKQLERMDKAIAVVSGARGRRSALKGTKLAPKYKAPSGETWAGRGAKPRWLVNAIKGGKKIDDFLIDKGRNKRRLK